MENIIQPNKDFDFSKLSLAHPTGIQGGAYFTKIEHNNNPLYIQTTKSLTRNGFVKTGKKYYCDLMFDNNSGNLINWFENLEEKCQTLIYEKSETWFQDALEMTDVESAFNSVIRVYKSGKFYLVRVNVKNSPLNHEPVINIYDENESQLTLKDVTTDTNIISILEIQGIKFTSRNFQIDIELKQVMILNNEPIFENCLIKKNTVEHLEQQTKEPQTKEPQTKEELIIERSEVLPAALLDLTTQNNDLEVLPPLTNLEQHDILEQPYTLEYHDVSKQDDMTGENLIEEIDNYQPISLDLEIVELKLEDLEEVDGLKDVELEVGLENNLESFTLKKRNQVYAELYKEARKKAKSAKKTAILAYLEAKNIKKSYMIENLNDSDSDFDAEIDEVSESELEGL